MKRKVFYSIVSFSLSFILIITYLLFKVVYQDTLYLNKVLLESTIYEPRRLEEIYYRMLEHEIDIQRLDKLTKALRKAGKCDEAIQVLYKMHRLRRDDPRIQRELADLLSERGRFHEAELYYRILLKER